MDDPQRADEAPKPSFGVSVPAGIGFLHYFENFGRRFLLHPAVTPRLRFANECRHDQPDTDTDLSPCPKGGGGR